MSTPSSPVRFSLWPTQDGRRIGVATLDAEGSLNALTLAMIEALDQQLTAWEHDDSVVAVWLEGAGDRAFCAGGDIVALYRALQGEAATARDYVVRYFSAEYALDYRLHTYPKPLLAWGDGIVMGGGMGLLAGARHRLVTERSRLAMPEISIGLYPDVGASWFLNRMPPGIGAYLALTGAQLNARDALDLGLADQLVPAQRRDALIDELCRADYGASGDLLAHDRAICTALAAVADRDLAPRAQLWPWRDHLQQLTSAADAAQASAAILADPEQDEWLVANRRRLAEGCPLTAQLAWGMLRRHRHASLSEALRDELSLSLRCCLEGDLAEGVRALLIDKDKRPRWSHPEVASVPAAQVDAMLRSVWQEEHHPLVALGREGDSVTGG
ncbi:enoyl-CoA hydratase/isomerase family protein [Halomonas sp. ML-15]|uniref:enoyl-CoA hydratase/isomerase family protein n=1 Tax=Halomonas sp. ML-15 TaxID=2773305 RepID=UPI00174798BF|nr:enoyl-CoA hydratase/isomerase family protein [Halomonas sp. ML-15]MBD3895174.1 enoyl-CoA hydratase/isomerase family protein [Halomonas sp. ML-15]